MLHSVASNLVYSQQPLEDILTIADAAGITLNDAHHYYLQIQHTKMRQKHSNIVCSLCLVCPLSNFGSYFLPASSQVFRVEQLAVTGERETDSPHTIVPALN